MSGVFNFGRILRALCFHGIVFMVVLAMPGMAFCSSPRLLIALGPNCTFMAEDLLQRLNLYIVEGTTEEMRDTIKELDGSQPVHVTVMKNNAEALEYLAHELGYDYLLINDTLEGAVSALNVILPTIPTTDAQLRRTDPREVGQFYKIMMQVDRIFKDHHIHYWATCGTLLGAVRHQGMVPWDDDIDLAMMEDEISRLEGLRGVLAEHGLALYYRPDFGFYKIYPVDGSPITKDETLEVYPWKFPFVDIFPMTYVNGKVDYARRVWREIFPREYFLPEDVSGLCPELPFGPLMVPVPAHYLGYLTQMYGEDWNRVAYVQFSHRNESGLKNVKVDLVDWSPPKYVLPKQ
jgi:lipopolysaccharide cholinephosphotransferase